MRMGKKSVLNHFFTDNSSVRIGSGLRDLEQYDVALSELNRKGNGVNRIGLSNMRLSISPSTDDDGQSALQATSYSSARLMF